MANNCSKPLHGPYEDVHSLSVTPARAQVLYAATARQPWRSADGGRSWKQVPWPGPDDDMVIALAWDVADLHQVFAGTDGGQLYCSTDRGASWQAMPVTLESVAVGGLLVMPR